MKKSIAPSKIYIDISKIKNAGRGVFAKVDIKKGERVEKCPLLEISQNDPAFESPTLIQYLFFFGKNKEKAALALGFGSKYNHSDNPNVSYKIKPKAGIIEFVALDDIKKDEELTFNYRGKDNLGGKALPLWFEK